MKAVEPSSTHIRFGRRSEVKGERHVLAVGKRCVVTKYTQIWVSLL